MNVLRVAALLIYTFGVFAYGALLVYWFREVARATPLADTRTKPPSYQTMLVAAALWGVSFLWFLTNTLTVLMQLDPTRSRGSLWEACVWAGFWLAVSFPPLITHVCWAEVRESRSSPPRAVWGFIVGLTYFLALALAVVCTLGFTDVIPGVSDEIAGRLASGGTVTLFIGAALYAIAILARYPNARRTERDVQSARWHIVLFGMMAVLFVLVFGLDRQSSPAVLVGGSLEITAKSLPIAFLFVGTYFESRFEFFDLFVKRGLSLFVTVGLLVLLFAAVLPILHRYDTSWAAPWVYALVLLPFAMALPWLHGRIGAELDRRWLGRRFTTVEAVKHFLAGLRAATTEEQLVERAEAGLTGIFDAPAAVDLETGAGGTRRSFDAVEEIEIRSGGRLAGRLVMGRRVSEAPYFSEDVALLGSLADVFASLLENLRLQLREQEQDRLARDLSLHASRSELKALRAQINPHFLFNALNAIAGLIHRDPTVADRTVEKLAEVFRYALRGAEAEWTRLEDELDFVRAYLEVEQARFGARLRTEVQLADNARGARVPTMVVQTLVENAVKHGAAVVKGQVSVSIAARRDGDQLLIVVEDSGPGFAAANREPGSPKQWKPGSADGPAGAPARRGGYGLANIRQRLDGYFGAAAELVIDRDPVRSRTIVSVRMPFALHDVRPTQPAAESEVRR